MSERGNHFMGLIAAWPQRRDALLFLREPDS
jgi:hypothetical protein